MLVLCQVCLALFALHGVEKFDLSDAEAQSGKWFHAKPVVGTLWSSARQTKVVSPGGPFPIEHKTFKYDKLDITDRQIEAVYPSGQGSAKFPLVVYAHGLGDGGDHVMEHYSGTDHPLFEVLASWGYVVLAPRSCSDGCLLDCRDISPFDPPCFGNFYHQQLKTIDFALSSDVVDLPINHSLIAVAGHSMGGQATLFSAAYNASDYGIKAAVLHHAYTHDYPAIATIPHLIFTGTNDTTAPPRMAESVFNAPGAFATRGIVNKVGTAHDEPGGADHGAAYNPLLPFFTVAWFKVFVDETPQWGGHDFQDIIFGSSNNSLCGGGDGAMKTCTILGK